MFPNVSVLQYPMNFQSLMVCFVLGGGVFLVFCSFFLVFFLHVETAQRASADFCLPGVLLCKVGKGKSFFHIFS